ncbi:MAG: hypothetical protein EOL88_09400 [Bacteroidia bacterium]|nr:hypothetical protein [Bacteroidia bacterium]
MLLYYNVFLYYFCEKEKMHRIHSRFIKPDMKMSELINENYYLLLALQHFSIDFVVADKTVQQICAENTIHTDTFLVIANLYNGFHPSIQNLEGSEPIKTLIQFLQNSHRFYKSDIYPEIKTYIHQLQANHDSTDIHLIEHFFYEYFTEVVEHLDYEDDIAFPYFCNLIGDRANTSKAAFSVNEYREHHSDIETKLADLKNLLLKYIPMEKDYPLRRKFLFRLFELEFDLHIHSLIEETILLPLVDHIEKQRRDV